MKLFFVFSSFIWSCASALKRSLYFAKPEKLSIPVISVGNLQAGGTGKTPLVILIAKEAIQQGLRPCILTRGYHSQWEKTGGVISPGSPTPAVLQCGDEAALIYAEAPQTTIVIGKDRLSNLKNIRDFHTLFDLIILDDGFQYHAIKKDLEIVLMTSYTPKQKVFRDFYSSLKHAQMVVWTKGNALPIGVKSDVRVRFQIAKNFSQDKTHVFLVTAVGDPISVLETIRQTNLIVKKHFVFSDHYNYKKEEIKKILDESQKLNCKVVLTQKDWIKWKEHEILRSEVLVLETEVVFLQGREYWNQKLWDFL
ncbi:MAG: tetraacyldisaccharide 4'-kinase [Bdellovibrio sp.]|nr:tetraacyldisaccharide 4'-kinase [Bdellovibrio sp.]